VKDAAAKPREQVEMVSVSRAFGIDRSIGVYMLDSGPELVDP